MTRVNCIPVECLMDQHLIREHQEITRISRLARHLDDYGVYKMGAGHMKFFYNKGLYLSNRLDALYVECKRRGFNVTQKLYRPHTDGLNEDWEPTEDNIDCNLSRLQEKLEMRPNWYRFWSRTVPENVKYQIRPDVDYFIDTDQSLDSFDKVISGT